MTQEYFSPIVLDYIAQGREQGIEAGLRRSILLLLDSRGYSTTDADLQRLESEHDRSVLEAWVKVAANQEASRPFFGDH